MNESGRRGEILLRSAQFRRRREEGWKRLEILLERMESGGAASLSADEAQKLPLLYLGALSSLSVARNIALDRDLLLYLEDLSLRAYLAVYGPRATAMEMAGEFFRAGFPRAVRGMRWHLAAALALFLAGTAAGYALVRHDPAHYSTIIPAELAGERLPGAGGEELRRHLFTPWPGFVNAFVVFANSLFRHNAVIGVLGFGLGFMLGLPTMFLMIYNGMIVGAFVALHAEYGLTADVVGWLAIHGVTETTAILLCGASGFVLAEKIVFPGRLSRLENLARHGRTAAGVTAGAVGLLFVAGLIEGGFRQLINDTPGRYAFALMTAALWLYYFARIGRGPDDDLDNRPG
ncbi:MAG: stage II sporulation protein M [Planctomycetota bacterium]|nr:stage II sporulation protein M [Planctomycetota bacterium]